MDIGKVPSRKTYGTIYNSPKLALNHTLIKVRDERKRRLMNAFRYIDHICGRILWFLEFIRCLSSLVLDKRV